MINSLWPFTIRPFQRLDSVLIQTCWARSYNVFCSHETIISSLQQSYPELLPLSFATTKTTHEAIISPLQYSYPEYYLWVSPQRKPQAAMLACLVSTLCRGNNLYQVLLPPQDQISSTQKESKLDQSRGDWQSPLLTLVRQNVREGNLAIQITNKIVENQRILLTDKVFVMEI